MGLLAPAAPAGQVGLQVLAVLQEHEVLADLQVPVGLLVLQVPVGLLV